MQVAKAERELQSRLYIQEYLLYTTHKGARSSPDPIITQASPCLTLSALPRLYFTSDFNSAVTLSFGGAAPPVVGNPMKILNES